MKNIFYLSAVLLSVSLWSKPVLNLECVHESGYERVSVFNVKIDFDKNIVNGLLGVYGCCGYFRWMELKLVEETDNSYHIHQEPVDNEKIIFKYNIQMRWVLNRSTGKLIGEEWNDRYGWESSVEPYERTRIIANCSKVNSEKLF
ncbi:hypothetical protein M9C84_06465 [SAR86 cluster bacterium]|jgi:hypothetical protein|nr:hypothetical protein M9C84_06465 [SAR86 cluster bacterium]